MVASSSATKCQANPPKPVASCTATLQSRRGVMRRRHHVSKANASQRERIQRELNEPGHYSSVQRGGMNGSEILRERPAPALSIATVSHTRVRPRCLAPLTLRHLRAALPLRVLCSNILFISDVSLKPRSCPFAVLSLNLKKVAIISLLSLFITFYL